MVDVDNGTVRSLAATAAAECARCSRRTAGPVAFVVSDDPPTWATAARVDVVPAAGGAPRAARRDPRPAAQPRRLEPGRRHVYFTETNGTRQPPLRRCPWTAGPAVELGRPDVMVDGASLNASRTHVGFTSQAPDRAVEAYAAELEKLADAVAGEPRAGPARRGPRQDRAS